MDIFAVRFDFMFSIIACPFLSIYIYKYTYIYHHFVYIQCWLLQAWNGYSWTYRVPHKFSRKEPWCIKFLKYYTIRFEWRLRISCHLLRKDVHHKYLPSTEWLTIINCNIWSLSAFLNTESTYKCPISVLRYMMYIMDINCQDMTFTRI